ncbi:MAG: hypothetical protein GEU87_03130 [Alphaproteobacteria bacterium]|nr:hypothetical protein [Alphaproteobacteria bacterium]
MNALAAADPSSPEAASLWARYLKDWTFCYLCLRAGQPPACEDSRPAYGYRVSSGMELGARKFGALGGASMCRSISS